MEQENSEGNEQINLNCKIIYYGDVLQILVRKRNLNDIETKALNKLWQWDDTQEDLLYDYEV
ncbi:hypothetical protein [Clostridium sp.]|uniref:hypothetical protein n=1 Tax=Clostridium sp. TaxID=1506 RepID=UPI0026145A58|nr:hypothetical protein [Clostridium sp.]